MIDKLQLACEHHPKPYKVSWFKKGGEIMVNQRSRIIFFIGKYEDEIYFDVLPMDAFHLLIGRPWKFERYVQHDGRKNTYTFVKNGVKYVLNPLKDVPTTIQSTNEVSLLSYKEFKQTYKEDGIAYALVAVANVQGEVLEVPDEVEKLFHRFKGLASDELPAGLP
ncbi:hypothetical protein CsSME_00036222 [Camellia sinensis var. sinensis]